MLITENSQKTSHRPHVWATWFRFTLLGL